MVRRIPPVAAGALMVLLATGVTLSAALALKAGCLTSWGTGPPPSSCYNDLQTVWSTRDLGAHAFPYQGAVTPVYRSGHLWSVELGAGEIEYPLLTGLFAWLTSLPVTGPQGFLLVSAVALTPFALISALALYDLAGRRVLLFALSPLLAAFAFLNWDLLPVTAVATALWAWRRDRVVLAGVLLGAGTCAKIWPALLLVPLSIELVAARRWRALTRFDAAATGTVLALNLPFVISDARGWLGPFLQQAVRVNDRTTNSVWFFLIDRHDYPAVALWSAVAVGLAWVAVLLAGAVRWHRSGHWPAVPVAAAMVGTSILLGRVDSPQYGLWLLPFLVVLRVRPLWTALYVVADLWLWLQWSWLSGTPTAKGQAAMFCWIALAALVIALLRSPEVGPAGVRACSRAGPSPAHCSPPPARSPAGRRARSQVARRTGGPG
jgi:glycosyl transferase family 87